MRAALRREKMAMRIAVFRGLMEIDTDAERDAEDYGHGVGEFGRGLEAMKAVVEC